MKEVNKEELLKIDGGLNISGTLINSFTNIIKVLLDVGRSIGTSIRRINDDELCPISK